MEIHRKNHLTLLTNLICDNLDSLDVSNNLILLTNLICKGPFNNKCFLYLKYKEFDLDEESTCIIQDFLERLECLEELDDNRDFFISTIISIILRLKGDLVELCNDRIVCNEQLINFIEQIKLLTASNQCKQDDINELEKKNSKLISQSKTWIQKCIDSTNIIKTKDQEINKLQDAISKLSSTQIVQDESIQNEISRLFKLNTELIDSRNKNEKIIRELKKQVSVLKSDIDIETKSNSELIKQVSVLKSDIDLESKSNSELIKQISSFNSHIDKIKEENNTIIKEKNDLHYEFKQQHDLNESNIAKIKHLQELLEKKDIIMSNLSSELEKYKKIHSKIENQTEDTYDKEFIQEILDEEDTTVVFPSSEESIDSNNSTNSDEIVRLSELSSEQTIKITNLEKKFYQLEKQLISSNPINSKSGKQKFRNHIRSVNESVYPIFYPNYHSQQFYQYQNGFEYPDPQFYYRCPANFNPHLEQTYTESV